VVPSPRRSTSSADRVEGEPLAHKGSDQTANAELAQLVAQAPEDKVPGGATPAE